MDYYRNVFRWTDAQRQKVPLKVKGSLLYFDFKISKVMAIPGPWAPAEMFPEGGKLPAPKKSKFLSAPKAQTKILTFLVF